MWRELFGLDRKVNSLAEVIVPKRSFSDVILPPETRQQLYEALTQIEKHRLIFTSWGLGERHPTATGLAFNFAGPPGTGKTVCAEAVAYTLGKKLLRVSYAQLESMWVGETGKNIRAVFREARTQDAILFFDEADSMAGRRFSDVRGGHEREVNLTVNILLTELEEHEGVVIFATNMASNFDPAFERRIRTHILFRMPSVAERERIWKVQVHPEKTPLEKDVDFRELAERFEVVGGDIRNAVLKAAQIAAAEDGPDERKRLQQKQFIMGMEQVLAAKAVMEQNLMGDAGKSELELAMELAAQRFQGLDEDLNACRTELGILTEGQAALGERMDQVSGELREEIGRASEAHAGAIEAWRGDQESVLAKLEERLERQEKLMTASTLLPWRRQVAVGWAPLSQRCFSQSER
jgi:SpoVK/Ycf46/Vps4 family AAA+-type ATPase